MGITKAQKPDGDKKKVAENDKELVDKLKLNTVGDILDKTVQATADALDPKKVDEAVQKDAEERKKVMEDEQRKLASRLRTITAASNLLRLAGAMLLNHTPSEAYRQMKKAEDAITTFMLDRWATLDPDAMIEGAQKLREVLTLFDAYTSFRGQGFEITPEEFMSAWETVKDILNA